MFWKKKQADPDALDYQLAQVSDGLSELEADVSTHRTVVNDRLRRIDDQLRQMHERLDRMEGIR